LSEALEVAGADPIDIAVGARVRIRRKVLSISQTDLAEALGISFQQVQKYERGANRVSASMLVRIAKRLGTMVGDLVGEVEGGIADRELLANLAAPGVVEIIQVFAKIRSSSVRSAIITVAEAAAAAGAATSK
jgi:transcriptional regulator with XRE-family HTH domain